MDENLEFIKKSLIKISERMSLHDLQQARNLSFEFNEFCAEKPTSIILYAINLLAFSIFLGIENEKKVKENDA